MTWQRTTLGEIALGIRNGLFARRPTDNPCGSRILRISAVRGGRVTLDDSRFVEGLEPAQIEKFSLNAGDLLITRYNGSRALVGVSGIVPAHDGPVIHPDKLIRIVLDRNRAAARFVNYQLQSTQVRSHLEPRIRTTAGQSGIAGADVRSIPLDLPPLDEQHRIVDLLEDHLSRLDAADSYLAAASAREAVLHAQLLVAALLEVEVVDASLADTLAVGLANGRSVPTREGGFPVLRLTALRDGRIDLAERKGGAWTEEDAARFVVKRGDFLISRGNGSLRLVGLGGLVVDDPDAVAYPDTLIRARPDLARLSPEYLALVWNSPNVRRQIEAAAKTTAGIYKVNQRDLGSVTFPLPSRVDQAAVVAKVRGNRDALALLSRERQRTTSRADALRRSLLSAAFSGHLTGAASRDTDTDMI